MFVVLNKEKIFSYLISVGTVIMLFAVAIVITNQTGEAIQTSSSGKEIPIYNVATEENKVALTFDCAWNADDVDEILEVLKSHNAKCTFFVVGTWADKYQDAVKKIHDAGHEIANHSYDHAHVNNLSLDKNLEDIEKCNQIIEKITGKKPLLYRGPYGEYNDTVMKAVKSKEMFLVQWNADSLDYKGISGDEMWNNIESKITKGSIILMHNGTENTAKSLSMIIENIKKKGYDLTTASDLIYKENFVIDHKGTQILQDNVQKNEQKNEEKQNNVTTNQTDMQNTISNTVKTNAPAMNFVNTLNSLD